MMAVSMMMMLMETFSSGASLAPLAGRSGALASIFFASSPIAVAMPQSTCEHCRGFLEGCPGGDVCPLVAGVNSNIEAINKQSITSIPSLTSLLPPELLSVFPRSIVETIIGTACAPPSGTALDFSSDSYKTSSSVVKAAIYGHCSVDDAMLELTSRLDERWPTFPERCGHGSRVPRL